MGVLDMVPKGVGSLLISCRLGFVSEPENDPAVHRRQMKPGRRSNTNLFSYYVCTHLLLCLVFCHLGCWVHCLLPLLSSVSPLLHLLLVYMCVIKTVFLGQFYVHCQFKIKKTKTKRFSDFCLLPSVPSAGKNTGSLMNDKFLECMDFII